MLVLGLVPQAYPFLDPLTPQLVHLMLPLLSPQVLHPSQLLLLLLLFLNPAVEFALDLGYPLASDLLVEHGASLNCFFDPLLCHFGV